MATIEDFEKLDIRIGKHRSEALTLGVPDENGNVVLLRPDRDAPVGGRLY